MILIGYRLWNEKNFETIHDSFVWRASECREQNTEQRTLWDINTRPGSAWLLAHLPAAWQPWQLETEWMG